MKPRFFLAVIPLILDVVASCPASAATIAWEKWSDDVFQRSAREKKLVILDLEAVWCHWCHVMEKETYADPKVIQLISKHCIAKRVDQDARPDLSSRYQDYGWPATIVFNAQGKELVKRAGYLSPDEMATILQKCVRDPNTPETLPAAEIRFASQPLLDASLRDKLREKHYASDDAELGGLKLAMKFMDADTVDWAFMQADQGSTRDRDMATRVLKANIKLIDPVWGGVYQYSTQHDWNHPHYEKIMSVQSNNLRIYALAYGREKDAAYLKAAKGIYTYTKSFLFSSEGVFFTSQDADAVKGEHSDAYFAADDAERRKQGVPAVDKHIYARENGWMIQSLCSLYAVTGESQILQDAIRSADWITAHRSLPGGGFRHDEVDAAGPYLGDSLAMGRAFLALYTSTADRRWLKLSEGAAGFIGANFVDGDAPGLLTNKAIPGSPVSPVKQMAENIAAARFANLLYRYTGDKSHRALAEKAMTWLATPEIALENITEAEILIADLELSTDPLHITVLGAKKDSEAEALFRSALAFPCGYKRLDWLDAQDGPLPNLDVRFPKLPHAAAFICTNGRCSLPIYESAAIAERIVKSRQRTGNK